MPTKDWLTCGIHPGNTQKIHRADSNDHDLHQGFALVAAISMHVLGMRPYRVQLAGGLAIVNGCIAEMATGEGKTLVATLPAVIAGWRGRGCHVLTDNVFGDRDAEEMHPLYEAAA